MKSEKCQVIVKNHTSEGRGILGLRNLRVGRAGTGSGEGIVGPMFKRSSWSVGGG
jgi:hypothetical protein